MRTSGGYVEPVVPPPEPWHLVAQQAMAFVLQTKGVLNSPAALGITYQPLTPPNRLGLLNITLAASLLSGRAARGPVAPRKMACRPAVRVLLEAVQGHRLP